MQNVKSKGTSRKVFNLPHVNEVSKCYAHIRGRFELETTKLALIDKVVRNCMELKSITDGFFNEFTQYVQQNDGSERLRVII